HPSRLCAHTDTLPSYSIIFSSTYTSPTSTYTLSLHDALPIFQFLQDHRGDFRRAVNFAEDLHPRVVVRAVDDLIGNAANLVGNLFISPAHEPLDGIDRVFRVGHRLALGYLPDQAFPGFGDADH